MIDDLSAALEHSRSRVASRRSAWILGVGRLLDVPAETGVTDQDVLTLGDLAHEISGFPLGPISYADTVPEISVQPRYRSVIYRHDDPEGAHMEVHIGLGAAGYVGAGSTRTGRSSVGPDTPGHVLLADVEAKAADLLGVLLARAAQLGYTGPAELALTVTDDIPGHPLTFRVLDPESGRLAPAGGPTPLGVVRTRIDTSAGVDALYPFLLDMACEAGRRSGLESPQFLYPLDSVPIEMFREPYDARFSTAARLRGEPLSEAH